MRAAGGGSSTPTFVAVASASGTAATLAVSVPTGTADGDLMVAMLASGNSTPAFAAGWTTLGSALETTFGWRVGWRRASSEPGSYTMTGYTTQASALIATYRNAGNPTGYANGVATDFSTTTITFPAGAAAGDGLWLCLGAMRSASAWSAGPASHNVRALSVGNANRPIHLADLATSGTPSTTTATAAGSPVLVMPTRLCVPRL